MHFIRSEFRGLLPGRFSEESLTKVVENFNDKNKEELDKYVSVLNFNENYKIFCFVNLILLNID